MTTTPRQPTIAVDLTPLLPGGENGGAKIFVLELLRRLARLAPQARFVLLTQSATHEELAALDAGNVRRHLALGPRASAWRSRLFGAAALALRPLPSGLRALAARAGYRLNARFKRGAPGLLRALGADLLYCPFTAPTFHERGVPAVCTIYDLQFRAFPDFFAVEDREQRERAFVEACAKAARLAAISEFTREAAMRAGGVEPARIVAIPLRLAPAGPPGGEGEAARRLGLAPGRYLVYPANFWPHKNHAALLEAFARAASSIAPDVRLALSGAPGGRQAAVLARARSLGLADRVVYAGFLPEEALRGLVAGAAGLVFPSLYEGFGLPVAEAMALGVPVACSRAAALPEVAGGAALLFDPEDVDAMAAAMVTLAADAQARARLVERGLARARELADADRMAREYWALFESAMVPTGAAA